MWLRKSLEITRWLSLEHAGEDLSCCPFQGTRIFFKHLFLWIFQNSLWLMQLLFLKNKSQVRETEDYKLLRSARLGQLRNGNTWPGARAPSWTWSPTGAHGRHPKPITAPFPLSSAQAWNTSVQDSGKPSPTGLTRGLKSVCLFLSKWSWKLFPY